jgi:hypothetical protein
MKLATDETGVKAPVVGFSAFETVSFNSSTSTAASTTVPAGCNGIRVTADKDCFVIVGPTANKTTSMFLAAGQIDYLFVSTGNTIAVIGDLDAGRLNIGFMA